MKLIPNIQKELDALMADPLNYQDPNGILIGKDRPRYQRRSISDAFIILEESDFEVADKLIAAFVKTERGKKLRNAYSTAFKNLSEGRFEELEVETGKSEHTDYIIPYYDNFFYCLLKSINYRKGWGGKTHHSDLQKLIPALRDTSKLKEYLLRPADHYRCAAISNYKGQREFEEALSQSPEYLQPFI